VSDHNPQDIESKDLEFDLADNGMVGLESCFGVFNAALASKVPLENIIDTITKNPRSILGIDSVTIKEGVEANLTLFNPTKKNIFDKSHLVSSNKNSGIIGKELKGGVIGVVNNNQYA
jgi:dihydroorotase